MGISSREHVVLHDRFKTGNRVVIGGRISTITHISRHPAGFYVHFDNRHGMSLSRLNREVG